MAIDLTIPLFDSKIKDIFDRGTGGFKVAANGPHPKKFLEDTIRSDIFAFAPEEELKDKDYELFPIIAEKARATGKSFRHLFAKTMEILSSEQEYKVAIKTKATYWQDEINVVKTTVYLQDHFVPKDLLVAIDNYAIEVGYGILITSYTYDYDEPGQILEINLKYRYIVDFARQGVNLNAFYDINIIPVVNLLHNLNLAIDFGNKYIWEKTYLSNTQVGGKMRLNLKSKGDNLDQVFEEAIKKYGARVGLAAVMASMFYTSGGTSTWGEDLEDHYAEGAYDCIFGVFTHFESFRFDDLRWNEKPDTYKDLLNNIAADAKSLKIQAQMMEYIAESIKVICDNPANKIDYDKKVNYKNLLKTILKDAVLNNPIVMADAKESDVPMTRYHQNTPYVYVSAALSEMAKSIISGEKSE